MSEIKSRVQSRRASKEVSNTSTDIPLNGEIIIIREGNSTPYNTTIKVGDGKTALKDLKEIGDNIEFTAEEIQNLYEEGE